MQWKNPKTGIWEDINLSFFGRRIQSLFVKLFAFRIRKIKLITYKRKKVKQTKVEGEKTYTIYFNMLIRDADNPRVIGPMKIEIPAKAMFFAKRKLITHLQHNLDIDVLDFDISTNKSEEDEEEENRS